jgi:hypothetical protein
MACRSSEAVGWLESAGTEADGNRSNGERDRRWKNGSNVESRVE